MKIRKLDILMIKSFLGPFFLTTSTATFILLIQYLLKYFDDLVGKNLGASVFGELLFYFALNMLQNAIPLGVLVASLMTFGNLGEHFELTAIKSAGISLVRTLRPIFLLVCLVAIGVFFFNNNIIPAANLKAYSLLYDIKQTKPALDIKAGAFYNGIPDYSIKVKEKYPDGKSLKDIIIYDHTDGRNNKTVILADSSLMYTILDERYLKLELYDGHYYNEEKKTNKKVDEFSRTSFNRMDLVFNLASFDLKRRNADLFQNNRQMKNIAELTNDADSFRNEILKQKGGFIQNSLRYFSYHMEDKMENLKYDVGSQDSVQIQDSLRTDTTKKILRKKRKLQKASVFPLDIISLTIWDQLLDQGKNLFVPRQKDSLLLLRSYIPEKVQLLHQDTITFSKTDSVLYAKLKLDKINLDTLGWDDLTNYLNFQKQKKSIASTALGKARNVKVNLASTKSRIYSHQRQVNLYIYERDRKYAISLACIIMFLIGAPLGAIIKKGGLGAPVIIAISFFIIYYVVGSIGKQQTKELQLDPYTAAWMANAALLPCGLFFLRQARIDARLFDVDVYTIWIEKLKARFAKKSN